VTDAAGYLRTVAEAEAESDAARWAAAAALWEQVVARNPVNGSHWDRLAEACFERGDYRRAQAAYERVLDLGAWGGRLTQTVFSGEVAYRMACCQARLGDRESAAAALRRALDLGFRDLGRPRSDPLWEPLRGDHAVREMLGDGHAFGEVLAALEPLISRDNDQQLTWLGPEVLPCAPAW
jgi:tetratricopeptide (TPR) repeat protein